MGKIYQVIVNGFNGVKMTIDLCNTDEQMKAVTVLRLKEKIAARLQRSAGSSMDFRLISALRVLVDEERTLVSYGVQNKSLIHMVLWRTDASIRRLARIRAVTSDRMVSTLPQFAGPAKEPNTMSVVKAYDPLDQSFKFVDRPDDIDPYEDQSLRAEMSCGHAVTPESLTGWCRSLLSRGQCKFICPALQPDGTSCGAEWSYPEVRRFALLTVEEMEHFEKELARIVAAKSKACPGCKTYVEREDSDNLCFNCTVCKESNKPTMQFCWQCLKPWKGTAPRSDRCDNDGCSNKELELLKGCGTITLSQVRGVGPCPAIRACPTCGRMVEHDKTGCKNVTCPRCDVEFCFVCLKLTPKCLKTSSYFIACSSGIAPRQTAMPRWNK